MARIYPSYVHACNNILVAIYNGIIPTLGTRGFVLNFALAYSRPCGPSPNALIFSSLNNNSSGGSIVHMALVAVYLFVLSRTFGPCTS